MKNSIVHILRLAVFALPALTGRMPAAEPDPDGILRQPIPDKLVVLTFDDGPLSGYTEVAPVLKTCGFGGSFYVCDFDSFNTRKDWYMTWRQMKALAEDGFEIGNHSKGHGSGLDAMLNMEDELLAHHVPKPITIAWPLYQANPPANPEFSANGYLFARGGHSRPYRPTVDHPLDIPSLGGGTLEEFVKSVRQAAGGRIVTICFHGVPDMEHPAVSLEPAVFKVMMQYLMDNHYKVIALRDLAEYIDPVKAAKLPPTANDFKATAPVVLATEDKPIGAVVSSDILEFRFPDQAPAAMVRTHLKATVPYGTDVTVLAPHIKVSEGVTVVPASGVARDFTTPQTYTATGKDGTAKVYTAAVKQVAASAGKDMLTFSLEGQASVAIAGTRIGISVPAATEVTKFAPTFTLSPFARVVPASGTARNFSTPQTYTVTAQDGSWQLITVKLVKNGQPNAFSWNGTAAGNWSDASMWTNYLGTGVAPMPAGRPDYILSFKQSGNYVVTNDLSEGFQLNHLVLGDGGGGLTLAGNGITFTNNIAGGVPPVIGAGKCQRINLDVAINLAHDLSVNTVHDKDPNCFVIFNGVVSGAGALTLNSFGDPDVAGANFHDVHWGILEINNSNTYRGGTTVSGGRISVKKLNGLGTGPVTLDHYGRLSSESALANPLIINSGTLFQCAWGGPITLNGIASFIGNCTIHGDMSGCGGLTLLGTNGTYLNMVPGGTVTLQGTNTYTGPTTVFPGTLIVNKATGLYDADPARWTPANIVVSQAATLRLNAGGPGEFTGPQISTLLAKLTTGVNHNGLMAGSTFCLDTANATGTVRLAGDIADGKGPGGGPFVFTRCGGGTLQLSGKNTYTGQTIMEGGTLRVTSLNSVVNGKASSSLGAPTNIETGEIVIGSGDGECTLIYAGTGETSDRVINLAGRVATVTFEQAGTGLLKLTSDFVISGYGANKTIVLRGDTAGAGEIAGNIANPHDRAGKATTALTKSGTGTWTLSGINSHTGPTTVTQGTLAIANARGLGDNAEVLVADGALLELKFKGELIVHKLTLGGSVQAAGKYGAANAPRFIEGTGSLMVRP